jgi:polyhydroxybutyrate depolymerase
VRKAAASGPRTGALARSLLALAIVLVALASCRTAPVMLQTSRDDHLVVSDGDVSIHLPPHHSDVGVVVLHSLGNSAAEPPAQGWSKLSDSKGFVGIYPERGDSWNAGLCCGTAAATDRDDVTWLAAVIAQVRARYGLKFIYLAGFSNGGMMVERFVVEQPDVSSCFAVWGAAPEMPQGGYWPGQGTIFDGALDNIVPASGGIVMIGDPLEPAAIRPVAQTGDWLRGAQIRHVVVPGYGHKPPLDWPERAWSALAACGR